MRTSEERLSNKQRNKQLKAERPRWKKFRTWGIIVVPTILFVFVPPPGLLSLFYLFCSSVITFGVWAIKRPYQLTNEERSRRDKLRASVMQEKIDNPPIVYCPKCGSKQLSANQMDYNATKGLAGSMVFGTEGLLVGFAGKHKILITCMNCGYHWKVK